MTSEIEVPDSKTVHSFISIYTTLLRCEIVVMYIQKNALPCVRLAVRSGTPSSH